MGIIMKELLYSWVSGQFSVLVPKKRGTGFLKTPYGHHHNIELSRIESNAGCDLWGLDGSLDFQVSGAIFHGGRDGQLAFSGKVMPLLEQYYGVSSREVGPSDFWRLHPMKQEASRQGAKPV